MALLRIQLMIAPIIPGRASAAFTPNFPSSDAKALSLCLSYSFRPALSLRGGSPPDAAIPPQPPGSRASTSTLITILIAVSIEEIIMPCSLNSVRIFLPNEVSLSNTSAIVSLKLVIWFFSLPLRRSTDLFSLSIHLLMSSLIVSS